MISIKKIVIIFLIVTLAGVPLSAGVLDDLDKELDQVTAKVLPTVVSIVTEKNGKSGKSSFFGIPLQQLQPKALGSGVIIDKRGYIVTNYHVVKNSSEIVVILFDKSEYKCTIVGIDPATDLAIIKINNKVPSNLPVISIADSTKLRPGQIAIAVGNAFGFSHTVTMGIVSAINRENLGIVDYENLIQTDAAINPGNSGGALINAQGELIGINTAIYSRSGGSNGLGFAIPSNQVRFVSEELIKHGKIIRGYLGVQIQDLTKPIAKNLEVSVDKGVVVTSVFKNSPAQQADLRPGDVIIKIDSKDVENVSELRKYVARLKPGTDVTFYIIRKTQRLTLKIKIGIMPTAQAVNKNEINKEPYGFVAASLEEEAAYQFQVLDTNGALVVKVTAGSSAEQAGLHPGDLIKEIEGEAVMNNRELITLLNKFKKYEKITFLIKRGRVQKYLHITPSR